jgi:hypothetical protein
MSKGGLTQETVIRDHIDTKQRPGSFQSRANLRFGLTAHSHGQVMSGCSSDEGLCSKMDFVILKVRLTT